MIRNNIEKEINKTFSGCSGDKSLDLIGFTMALFEDCWKLYGGADQIFEKFNKNGMDNAYISLNLKNLNARVL